MTEYKAAVGVREARGAGNDVMMIACLMQYFRLRLAASPTALDGLVFDQMERWYLDTLDHYLRHSSDD